MSARYREHAAPERLRPYVECFWSIALGETIPDYPVLPDGCVDIVYSPSTGPQVVGTMTRVQRFTLEAGQIQMGVRFRPGMAPGFVRAPGSETTDRLLPLDDVWGAKGRQLAARIGEAKSEEQCIALLEAQLVDASEPGIVQKMSAYIVDRSGQVRVDDLAFDAAMSARHLRRLFLEQMGLTPKHFCRVIRFRHSLPRLRSSVRGDWTKVALDCGYYDQAHFINEFREFSGYTPGEFAALPR
jgi:AraC-like DNA-binding protein